MAIRIDKWLWAARFFKTRSQARDAIDGGKVHVEGIRAKPSREVQVGQEIVITLPHGEFVIHVKQLSEQRGSGTIARTLYEETAESIERREKIRQMNALSWNATPQTKPDTRDRRLLRQIRGKE